MIKDYVTSQERVGIDIELKSKMKKIIHKDASWVVLLIVIFITSILVYFPSDGVNYV